MEQNSRIKYIVIAIVVILVAVFAVYYYVILPPKEIGIEKVEYVQNGALQPMMEGMIAHPSAGLVKLSNIKDNQVRLLSDDRVQYLVTYESKNTVPDLYDYFKSYFADSAFSVVSDMPSADLSSFALDAVNGSDLFHLYAVRNVKDDGTLFSDVVVSLVVK